MHHSLLCHNMYLSALDLVCKLNSLQQKNLFLKSAISFGYTAKKYPCKLIEMF